MTSRKAFADKIMLLGIDGMDPRLTRKYVDEGIMPNTAEYIKRGAARHDLVMLGGHPTVTPPMWTTLATGAYANVHGITGFFRKGNDIDEIDYNLDSRNCKAEPIWNVLAEAGKKTLVFHWPGSAWPPTSDSENLFVVDGTAPGVPGMSSSLVDHEFIFRAGEEYNEVTFIPAAPIEASAACVTTDLADDDAEVAGLYESAANTESKSRKALLYKLAQGSVNASEGNHNEVVSPIKPAEGWENAPEGALECTILYSMGYLRRPVLILKNEEGIYDRVAIYKKKKDTEPIVTLFVGKSVRSVIDDAMLPSGGSLQAGRNHKLLRLDPEGKSLILSVSYAMAVGSDALYHPKRIYKGIVENCGLPATLSMYGMQDDMLITECMLDDWYGVADWQADALHYMIEKEGIEMIFSHYHSIDLEEHQFIKHLAERDFNRNPVEVAEKWMRNLYIQADYYLGKFLHFLDEGWTILIFSDHAQVAPKHDVPMLCDLNGVCTPVMEELGYTVLQRNAEGKKIPKIDWTKTRAVVQREGHIYLNIKGREKHVMEDGSILDGIVDPADQYELEEQIMTDLYGYKDKKTGHRVFSVALRNRDAVLLGQGGPEGGDIIAWHAEGYNFDHSDCLSTTWGEGDTSVSPIFIAAGKGIKEGFETDRIIRQIDFAATVAGLAGVRFPAQCEGAPVYPIFAEEF
ncbi:MAG: alkaline phosphatase family protein [Peptococcaceae bacterium]|nr:alkaline phosphatase family protein [Peptococcaceae bacterium]